MKRYIAVSLTLLLLLLNQAFAQSPSFKGPQVNSRLNKHPEVPRISAESAYLKYKAGIAMIIVDSMAARNYKAGHILGAINLPNDGPKDIKRLRNMKLPFPKNTEFIVY